MEHFNLAFYVALKALFNIKGIALVFILSMKRCRIIFKVALTYISLKSPDGVMYTFAITGGTLPSGITLNASTGVISGTTSSAGEYIVTITATNPVLERDCQLTLTVAAPASCYTYSQMIYVK